ncbi:amino acid ABC transporter permease [Amaricoccus solimangrovi]|uniref:Amino acid ABC transporter permease n=1 Tax=Amaricoccus solimangrovi TaxID=2589815 RepID=A0A501WQS4_9RHOB|nr:amino acid ABC transporter permease [Amaricoccus solimangrovi]TPE52123.1 amino acid ABC transporter permease [Amaricoccus solimangrovi]
MSWKLFWLLVEAARLTVLLSAGAIAIGFLIACLVCAGMLSHNRVARGAGRLFVSFFRGTPLLVQLLLIYYLLPSIGLDVPSEVAAITGMALCTAAYQAEIMRGGLGAVPSGLLEAAEMTGMSAAQTFRRIRLPIAFKLTLPALVSEAIMMLKSSSLVSVVGVIELTRMAQDLAASTYRPLELYAAAGLIYLVINIVVALLGTGLEARLRWGRI